MRTTRNKDKKLKKSKDLRDYKKECSQLKSELKLVKEKEYSIKFSEPELRLLRDCVINKILRIKREFEFEADVDRKTDIVLGQVLDQQQRMLENIYKKLTFEL